MAELTSPYSAAEQGLGYIYQGRFALAKILGLPESTAVLIEKEDDVDFLTDTGIRSLGSLKHKAEGDRLTDLSTDFWKSVRIWLAHYIAHDRASSASRFFLFTTAAISDASFLSMFTEGNESEGDRVDAAQEAIARSTSSLIGRVRDELAKLSEEELRDFYSRIIIVASAPRITDLPALIKQHLRIIRRESRDAVFERLEGWWTDVVIKMLAGERTEPVHGFEVSDTQLLIFASSSIRLF